MAIFSFAVVAEAVCRSGLRYAAGTYIRKKRAGSRWFPLEGSDVLKDLGHGPSIVFGPLRRIRRYEINCSCD